MLLLTINKINNNIRKEEIKYANGKTRGAPKRWGWFRLLLPSSNSKKQNSGEEVIWILRNQSSLSMSSSLCTNSSYFRTNNCPNLHYHSIGICQIATIKETMTFCMYFQKFCFVGMLLLLFGRIVNDDNDVEREQYKLNEMAALLEK